jgi:hypothetical protein
MAGGAATRQGACRYLHHRHLLARRPILGSCAQCRAEHNKCHHEGAHRVHSKTTRRGHLRVHPNQCAGTRATAGRDAVVGEAGCNRGVEARQAEGDASTSEAAPKMVESACASRKERGSPG